MLKPVESMTSRPHSLLMPRSVLSGYNITVLKPEINYEEKGICHSSWFDLFPHEGFDLKSTLLLNLFIVIRSNVFVVKPDLKART